MPSLSLITRARQARLPQVAGSLSFTTVLSIVPFLAVSFTLFTRFPAFRRFEQAIEEHLLKGLLPMEISRTVLRHLGRFADNASALPWLGMLFMLLAALALLLTVENALNQIWGVGTNRPFLRRVGLHLLMLAIGPPLLGLSLWADRMLVASLGLIGPLPPSLAFVLDLASRCCAWRGCPRCSISCRTRGAPTRRARRRPPRRHRDRTGQARLRGLAAQGADLQGDVRRLRGLPRLPAVGVLLVAGDAGRGARGGRHRSGPEAAGSCATLARGATGGAAP